MPPTPPGWLLERRPEESELRLSGDWVVNETGLRDDATIRRVLAAAAGAGWLRFDASNLGRWDSALIVFLEELRDRAARQEPQIGLDLSGLPEAAQRLLAVARPKSGPQITQAGSPTASLLVRVGQSATQAALELVEIAALVGETALRGGPALLGRTRTRAIDVLQLMAEAGARALGIVTIVNGLVGAILAFVGAVELRQFGAGIYVADLVGIAVVREMAPVMTAIVMAGRTGGAYAAQLATMQGNEEIDALQVLGIPVYEFLILPRILALIAMMPLLYLYACAVGLAGGLVVGLGTLGLAPAAYINEMRSAVSGTEFAIGLTKSVAFGALIAIAGCRIGLKAGRSAADVGHAATSAVVAGIIGVIALDAVFAVCTNALGM